MANAVTRVNPWMVRTLVSVQGVSASFPKFVDGTRFAYKQHMKNVVVSGLVLVAIAAGSGCGSELPVDGGGDGGTSSSGASGGFGSSGFMSSGGPSGDGGTSNSDGSIKNCVPLVLADGTSPQCSDCKDNDGDGKVDWLDSECAGPLDNDEKTFGTGIPGDNVDACKQDCFFDGNSGQGDDRCEWNLKCDPKNPGAPTCPYDADYKNCPATQSAQCKNFCAKLTPNGCDCFGCCAVNLPGGGVQNVVLSSTCSLADINDPAKCKSCTPNADCNNPCERCELCIGKTSVPADCAPTTMVDGGTPTGQVCVGGVACNEATPCTDGTYCITGCCVAPPR
jgi:hypothetical protein